MHTDRLIDRHIYIYIYIYIYTHGRGERQRATHDVPSPHFGLFNTCGGG